jgi:serine/threonine protein kinase/tetratricopeptide (TPR) repeat protein
MAMPTGRPWPHDPVFDSGSPPSARPAPVVHDPGSGGSTLDDLLSEFTRLWSRGEEPRAEAFLPRLASGDEDDAVELIYHEFCLAESAGRAPDPGGYLRRFPGHRARLARLLGLHEAIDPARLRVWAEPAELPEAGDEIGPYRLLRELGRGGLARVFLAEQADLADRLVVLKVAARASVEPVLLARASHPHIVQVLRHGEADGGALHLVCMPFLGGATLAEVLAGGFDRGRRPRSGRAFLAALDAASAPEFGPPGSGPARELIGRASYPRALAWLVARLAEALEHAQRRGVAHGDVKPSNVLIAADGRPMLLDFNLAIDWTDPDDGRVGGGTLAYMAPERLRALADPASSPRPRPEARHRADLYALGLLLREALTGEAPAVPAAAGPDRARLAAVMAESRAALPGSRLATHRAIPVGLRPIVARLLSPDPADRYGRAADLAVDLDRWRLDRPPAFADEPPRAARLARWLRRQRGALAAGSLVAVTGVLVGLAAVGSLDRSKQEQALARLERLWGGAEPGVYRFRASGHWDVEEPGDPAALAARHLAGYGLAGPGADGRAWRDRDDVRTLPEADRDDLEVWLLEQTWRLAAALRDRPEAPGDWRRAIDALDRVPEWSALGPFAALRAELVESLARAGEPAPGPAPAPGGAAPAPAWVAAYLDGLAAEPRSAEAARAAFRRVLAERPSCYWARYRAAAAGCRLVGGWPEALEDLRACLARRPENPALWTQLASGLMTLGRFDEARDALERALALEPDFGEAYRGRAILGLRQGRRGAFGGDAERFARLAGPSAGLARWEMAVRPALAGLPVGGPTAGPATGPLSGGEPIDARVVAAIALEQAGQPERALAAFDSVLGLEPEHLIARLRRASLLRQLRRPEAAGEFEALVGHPRFGELVVRVPQAIRALHVVADVRLRRGEPARALEPAERALGLSRALGQFQGESHYKLARVHAALARDDRRHLEPALAELLAARRRHPDFLLRWFPRDRVFDPIRAELDPLLGRLPPDARPPVLQ